MTSVVDWFQNHRWLLPWLLTLSTLLFVAGIALVPMALTRMPADYFMRDHRPFERWAHLHPFLRTTALVLKNGVGVVLLWAGIAMLVLPGQGLLTIFVGLTLMDFPRKRELELWLVRRRPVLRAINWIRRRARRKPLLLPDENRRES